MQINAVPPFLQAVHDPLIEYNEIRLHILRIDLMHPTIGGNKLFKLKYNLAEAKKQDKKTLITFGGAFSNHIAATASAGKKEGFKTIGIIRGEEQKELNPILKFAVENGMQLQFISRENYRTKHTLEFIRSLDQQFPDHYLIPEGGSNELGVLGCREILQHIKIDFDYVCCACGTGTTLAGIITSLKKGPRAIGFQVLRSEGYIKQEIEKWMNHFGQISYNNWNIEENYHFGGYAKASTELTDFIDRFERATTISLDLIYTGKMMYGIYDLIKKSAFKKGETIIAIHTGGLQGNAGFDYLKTRSD